MPSPLAEQMARVRAVVEALSPEEGASFANFTGTVPIEQEPSIADRVFQVRSAGTGAQRVDLMTRSQRFVFGIRYDLGTDQDAGEARMAADDLLLSDTIEDSANRADGVNVVTLAESSTDESQRASGFLTRLHTFEVLFPSDSF